MRALILDGTHPDRALLDRRARGPYRAAGDALHRALGKGAWTADVRGLGTMPVAYCRGCFECWVKTPGICRTRDAGRDVAEDVMGSDLVVFLTPVTFGGYSSELKKAVDRLIGIVSPFFRHEDGEAHHRSRYDRYPGLVGLGWLPEPDPADEATFRTLVRRNALNFHAPSASAGIFYTGDSPRRVREVVEGCLRDVGALS